MRQVKLLFIVLKDRAQICGKLFVIGLPLDIVCALLMGMHAVFLQHFVDTVSKVNFTIYSALIAIVLFIGINLASEVFNNLSNYLSEKEDCCVNAALTQRLQRRVTEDSAISFESSEYLHSLQKAKDGVDSIVGTGTSFKLIFSFYIPYFCIMASYFYIQKPALVWSILAVMVPSLISQFVQTKLFSKSADQSARVKRKLDCIEKAMVGRLNFVETRILGCFGYFMGFFKESLKEYRNIKYSAELQYQKTMLILSLFKIIGFLVVIMISFTLFIKQEITLGAFMATLSMISSLYSLMDEMISRQIGGIAHEFGLVENYNDFVDLGKKQKTEEKTPFLEEPSLDGYIQLKEVSFSYPNSEHAVLEKVNIQIKKGEIIAIVGENGSGKSTLAKIIAGLYPVSKGEHYAGGHKVTADSFDFLKEKTSVVFQNYCRYSMSIKDNIVISRINKAASKVQLDAICDKAGFPVDKFSHGYETVLSKEFGETDISSGQWQRLAIARGMFRDGDLLVFDEPTASLDPIEETNMLKKILELSKEKTAIIVTHRMGIVKYVDRVFVLHKGRIIEQGTHDELFRPNTQYSKLYASQKDLYKGE